MLSDTFSSPCPRRNSLAIHLWSASQIRTVPLARVIPGGRAVFRLGRPGAGSGGFGRGLLVVAHNEVDHPGRRDGPAYDRQAFARSLRPRFTDEAPVRLWATGGLRLSLRRDR